MTLIGFSTSRTPKTPVINLLVTCVSGFNH